ncbi:MAG: NAD/NADP octopine/nopaline dehydrogenase family protein [Proteobacteria bacterium]|nr:NAD/NADP octopine/nopaline dehydrogenase family protein [Pseudomonadota bacterium]
MKIAVIGGGHGCYAAAAHLSEDGHEVRLWRRDADALAPLLASGAIKLTDHKGTRDVPIAQANSDLAEAMDGAELINIPLPCTTHEALAPQLAPLLSDRQVVFLPPGTFGSYIFAKAMRDAGNRANVAFAETGTLPYLARKQAADHVRISVYATRLPTGVMPARDTDRAIAVLQRAYPSVEPIEDALSGALMNAGPIIHPPLIIMNAGPMEHFDEWDIHNEGTQPSIRRVTDALDNERMAVREALGYGAPHFPLADHYDDSRDEWMYGNSSHDRLTDSGDWREDIDLQSHRYMLEDTALGLSFIASVADWVGVEAPLVKGLLAIGSAVVGEDFAKTGRTLGNLGLSGLDRAGMSTLLREGPAS